MIVSAWRDGQVGYGVRIKRADVYRHFPKDWKTVWISFQGRPPLEFKITFSFWRKCHEIRGLAIREWFQELGYVGRDNKPNPQNWPKGSPPKFNLSQTEEGHLDLVPLLSR